VLKWPVLQTFPARLCLTFFNFCQPFLINRAITLSQEAISDGTTQIGYGLIAAYVIVYVGIAVSYDNLEREPAVSVHGIVPAALRRWLN
jgi:ATP-binding cassette, subfamily C (CFTR/MRP), member 1